jgi:hypothetical protein
MAIEIRPTRGELSYTLRGMSPVDQCTLQVILSVTKLQPYTSVYLPCNLTSLLAFLHSDAAFPAARYNLSSVTERTL